MSVRCDICRTRLVWSVLDTRRVLGCPNAQCPGDPQATLDLHRKHPALDEHRRGPA